MGHFRSEMGYEAEDAAEAARRAKTRERVAKALKKRIAEQGLEYVLADIVLHPSKTRMEL